MLWANLPSAVLAVAAARGHALGRREPSGFAVADHALERRVVLFMSAIVPISFWTRFVDSVSTRPLLPALAKAVGND